MATGQSQEHAEWRAVQKERERERRRMRDRERRQSMTLEERDKHLARRRRNYQLRRQRAANAQSGFHQQVNFITDTPTADQGSIRNDSLALVCVPEPSSQLDCGMLLASNEANQLQNPSAVKYGETALPGSYKYPQPLRLTQIKHLARLLNSSVNKALVASQESRADAINGEMEAPKRVPREGIRFIHLKHLIRVLHSKRETTSEQNDSDNMQGVENEAMQKEIEATIDGELVNRKPIDAIDEDEQICADSTTTLTSPIKSPIIKV